jgi:hypothetical protein
MSCKAMARHARSSAAVGCAIATFDFNVGKITFGNKLSFENSIVCIKCGLVEIDDLELTELGQTQVAELFLR